MAKLKVQVWDADAGENILLQCDDMNEARKVSIQLIKKKGLFETGIFRGNKKIGIVSIYPHEYCYIPLYANNRYVGARIWHKIRSDGTI